MAIFSESLNDNLTTTDVISINNYSYSITDNLNTIDIINTINNYVPVAGLPGHGATYTLLPTTIYAVGTVIPLYVEDALAFPPLSYIMITDGIYAITGQITSMTPSLLNLPVVPVYIINGSNQFSSNPNLMSVNIISLRITSIINGMIGLAIQQGAAVTFSGPPGIAGVTRIGDFGTVIFQDMIINPPAAFFSGTGVNDATVINTMNFILPNNQPLNYRVTAEFTGNVVTNQEISPFVIGSNIAYVGITSSAAQAAANVAATFAGYTEYMQGPFGGPVINLPTIIADGACTVNTAISTNTDNNVVTKYIGTFASGMQLDFSIVACAIQPSTSFYVQGMLTITAFPIYQYV